MANEVKIKITANDLASGKISKLRKGISGVNSTLEKNQRGMLAAGAASIAFGTLAVRAAADFDKGMREVNTLLNFSNAQLDVLSIQVRELSKEFGINAVDATKALYSTISAGQAPSEAISFLTVAAKTAIGGVTDLETAVDGLTSVVNAFGYESGEAQAVADIMFETMRRGKTTIGELSQFFFQAAPVASALGVRFEEVSAAITTLTLSGTPTRVAMTQVRQAMVSLAKPTAEMEKLFEAVGYESGLAAIRADGLVGALTKLQEESGATETEFIKAVGSIDSLQAVMGLTGKNTPAFLENMAAMENAAGNVDTAYAIMAESTSQSFAKMQQAMNDAKIEMGENLAPAMEDAAKHATNLSNVVGSAPAGLTTTLLALGATAGVIGILRIAIVQLAAAFTALKAATLFLAGAGGLIVLAVAGLAALVKVSNDAINMAKEHKDELDGVKFAMVESLDAYTKLQSAFNRREVWLKMNKVVSDLETQFVDFKNVVGFVAEAVEVEMEEMAQVVETHSHNMLMTVEQWAEDIVRRTESKYARLKDARWADVKDEEKAVEASIKTEREVWDEKRELFQWQADFQRDLNRQKLNDALQTAAAADAAEKALAENNLAKFNRIRDAVMRLPNVISSNLGLNMGGASGSGVATAMGVLKSHGAAAGFNAAGQLRATGITGKEVIIRPVNVSVNVEGDLLGEDMETKITGAMQDAAQKGAFMDFNPGGES